MIWGIIRFDHLAVRPMNPVYFTDYNKAEITAGYLAMMVVGYPLYPEISKEMWYMLFPSSEGKNIIFEDDFFSRVRDSSESYTELQWPSKTVLAPKPLQSWTIGSASSFGV